MVLLGLHHPEALRRMYKPPELSLGEVLVLNDFNIEDANVSTTLEIIGADTGVRLDTIEAATEDHNMKRFKICVVGGHCGVRMMVVAEHVQELLHNAGYDCEVTHQGLWDHPTPPRHADLILELLPAFSEAEAGCPVINIKPLLGDLDHPQVIDKVLKQMQSICPPANGRAPQ